MNSLRFEDDQVVVYSTGRIRLTLYEKEGKRRVQGTNLDKTEYLETMQNFKIGNIETKATEKFKSRFLLLL